MKKWFIQVLVFLLVQFVLYGQDLDIVRKAKPFSWTGAVGTSLTAYTMRGDQLRMNPFQYGVFAQVNIRLYETFEIPLALTYNQFGLDVQRPFYQLGISPRYKWAQVHLGHRNMFFNPYTLAGHTFWGLGVDLNPGRFRFSAMKGTLREPLLVDARTGQELLDPQFKREGWGFKLGVGSLRNYVDLMLFKAADAPESLPQWQDSTYQNSISGQTGRFAPAENLILGLTARFTLFSRVSWQIDAGGSLYTSDLSAEKLIQDNFLFTPRTSTTFKWAGKTSLNFPIGPVFMSAAYERILPDYFSMGAYQFVNDMENITISPSGSFWKGRLSISGMVGSQRNNLQGNRSETTRRWIANGNLLLAPSPDYGVNLAYTNFSFQQRPQAILLNDSLLIRQVNQSVSVMPYYHIVADSLRRHRLQAAVIWQEAEDLNPVTRDFGSLTTTMLTATYTHQFFGGWDLSGGFNHTRLISPLTGNQLTGGNLGLSRQLEKPAIQLQSNIQLNTTRVDGQSDGTLFNASVQGMWTLASKHQFRLSLNLLRSSSRRFTSYTEGIANVGYTFQIR
jgi:hypothetical protein